MKRTTAAAGAPPYVIDQRGYLNYYPFGMEQPGRSFRFVDEKGRYGYNGKEKDNDWNNRNAVTGQSGEGNSYDYGFRIYNPRLGRWLSIDPEAHQFPGVSPCIAFGDNPVVFNDPDGAKIEPKNLTKTQREDYDASLAVIHEWAKTSPTVARILGKAEGNSTIIHIRFFSADRNEKTKTKSKLFNWGKTLEELWNNSNFLADGVTLKDWKDKKKGIMGAEIMLGKETMGMRHDPERSEYDLAPLVLLDELMHGTTSVPDGDEAKKKWREADAEHYLLYRALLEDINSGTLKIDKTSVVYVIQGKFEHARKNYEAVNGPQPDLAPAKPPENTNWNEGETGE